MGTPEFAVPSLKIMIDNGLEIAGVFTQPDRPKGRGNRLTPSPVKAAAAEAGIPVFQPERIRRDGAEELVRALVRDKIDQDQLKNSGLSFDDLEKIILSFRQIYEGMFHERIKYPS